MRAAHEWELWSSRARIVVDDEGALPEAIRIADRELGRIDEAASRFRDDSELNRLAPQMPDGVELSPLLTLLIRRALDAAALTEGLVDPTLGRELDAVGYDRDIRLVLDDDRPVRAVVSRRPGWRSVRLVGSRLTVPARLALDLGATAKALAADLTAQAIAGRTGGAVLISLGGDVATAGPEPDGGWNVLVQDLPGEPRTTVRLAAGAGLATSSTQHRRWRRGDEWMHHILDPRTGVPASPVWRTVSVAAPSCFLANAYATAAIVRGASAVDWLAGRADARLVDGGGWVDTVGSWPREGVLAHG